MTEPALASAHQAPFDYALWKELLGTIVTYLNKEEYAHG